MFEHPIHPIVVHFPIALLFTSVFFEVLGTLMERELYREFGYWLLVLGLLGGVVAAGTGFWSEDAAKAAGVPEEAIDRHETFAVMSVIVFGLMLVFRRWVRGRWSKRYRAIYLVLGAAGVIVLGTAGYFGGDLVYRYGAGILKPTASSTVAPELSTPTGSIDPD
jgi:uncharacterized membrane protein